MAVLLCSSVEPPHSRLRPRRPPGSIRNRETVQSQQVLPRLCVRVLVCCCACAKLCVRLCADGEREPVVGGATEERGSNGIPDHSLPALTKDSSLRIPLASTRLLSRIMSSRLRKTSVCTPLPSRCTLRKYCCSAE